MDKDNKWLMLTHHIHKALLENEDCLRTGLYSWIPVFDGNVKHFKETSKQEIRDADIIHINMSGQDIHLVGEVRDILGNDSKTKIVVNNDYTVELWQSSFDYPPTLRRELQYADMIFGTEPNQVGTLEVLTKRKVHTIVHPCFVKRLKTLRPKQKLDVISVVSHRYDNYHIVPSLAVNDLGYKTRLIGYDKNADTKRWVTSTCYNEVLDAENYMTFCEQLMESKIVVDPFTLTSQSRVGWDCAAMGVPLVGSNRNYSVQKCFPYTAVSPYNIKEMREMIKKVLNDEKFRQKVIDYAQNAVEYVSYESSKKKYLGALKEGSPSIQI
jgi:glycosyltransferase involved in cell wall biosynthesis